MDPGSATHTQINQPSGGMEVKIVLAAAMWQILTLPFLTSQHYLDREGLGDLILAIKDHKDGCSSSLTWKLRARRSGGTLEDGDNEERDRSAGSDYSYSLTRSTPRSFAWTTS